MMRHDVCGWVVDLRQNTRRQSLADARGAWARCSATGSSRPPSIPTGAASPVWYRDGQAGFGDYTQLRVRAPYRVRKRRPVAVLLGPGTASSAEVLAVAFRSRRPTRSFGAPTRGLSAGNRTFALADGASLVLTVAATSDAAGRELTGAVRAGRGRAATTVPAGAPSADAALEAAVAWLAAGDSCR